jgi:hypothetical protein
MAARESTTDGNKLDNYFMRWQEARNQEIILNGATNPIQTEPGLGTFLTTGQLTVTGVKHPPPKHLAAYSIGYKLGVADGKRGGAGLPDGSGACNSGTEVNGTAATNQCLAGYFAAWSKYCPTSKYGRGSEDQAKLRPFVTIKGYPFPYICKE